jgi:mannitol-1-phosphate 5-dehydrogenase
MEFGKQNKAVVLGAGKIGRSFIGQLLSRGGYKVVFVDADLKLIDELNRRKNYNVIIKTEKEEILHIENVSGVSVFDVEKASEEISSASMMAVCVGLNNIPKIIPLLSKGLLKRYQQDKNLPLDIVLAENLRDAADFFKERLLEHLPQQYPLNELVGLVETSIGKMVPIMKKEDLEEDFLQVFAEKYNTLILDKKAFKNPIPQIEGLAPKDNMKAWVDRKLFIHNLGHAATAYLGYFYDPSFVYIYEPLAIPEIFKQVRETMLQSAEILLKKYPGEFTLKSLAEHVDDLLSRFQNKYLGDTIFRVGCDLFRKLSIQDRLAGAIHLALEMNLPFDKIMFALVCGCHFKAADQTGQILAKDYEFSLLYEKGIKSVLIEVCGFDEATYPDLILEAEKLDENLKQGAFRNTLVAY